MSKLNDSTVGNIVLNDDMVSRVWFALSNYSRWQVTEYFYEQKGLQILVKSL